LFEVSGEYLIPEGTRPALTNEIDRGRTIDVQNLHRHERVKESRTAFPLMAVHQHSVSVPHEAHGQVY